MSGFGCVEFEIKRGSPDERTEARERCSMDRVVSVPAGLTSDLGSGHSHAAQGRSFIIQ